MMNETSEIGRQAIFEIINNQIRSNTPPEVKETLKRLEGQGNSHEDAMKLIGCALGNELFEIMKNNQPFDTTRYVTNLQHLPTLPWD